MKHRELQPIAPLSCGTNWRRAITPHFAMLAHWHWDHVFSGCMFGLPTFAQHETARIVTKMAGLRLPLVARVM